MDIHEEARKYDNVDTEDYVMVGVFEGFGPVHMWDPDYSDITEGRFSVEVEELGVRLHIDVRDTLFWEEELTGDVRGKKVAFGPNTTRLIVRDAYENMWG